MRQTDNYTVHLEFFVRLDHIRKCFTQKGGIFVLEEYNPKTRNLIQRKYQSSMFGGGGGGGGGGGPGGGANPGAGGGGGGQMGEEPHPHAHRRDVCRTICIPWL
ncbi:GD24817 [Drosophila simulans]|uniref:GD24817 n=1 Tax=Drosophila simulans TaxID=7240 RepID=B4NUG6_DROSI|nr:GD24817 [Drosophila simulans]